MNAYIQQKGDSFFNHRVNIQYRVIIKYQSKLGFIQLNLMTSIQYRVIIKYQNKLGFIQLN